MCDIVVDMYVAKVPNRGSPPAILLRESYREDGKVKNRTLSNLSHWPEDKVEALSAVLKGLPPKHSIEDSFSHETDVGDLKTLLYLPNLR